MRKKIFMWPITPAVCGWLQILAVASGQILRLQLSSVGIWTVPVKRANILADLWPVNKHFWTKRADFPVKVYLWRAHEPWRYYGQVGWLEITGRIKNMTIRYMRVTFSVQSAFEWEEVTPSVTEIKFFLHASPSRSRLLRIYIWTTVFANFQTDYVRANASIHGNMCLKQVERRTPANYILAGVCQLLSTTHVNPALAEYLLPSYRWPYKANGLIRVLNIELQILAGFLALSDLALTANIHVKTKLPLPGTGECSHTDSCVLNKLNGGLRPGNKPARARHLLPTMHDNEALPSNRSYIVRATAANCSA